MYSVMGTKTTHTSTLHAPVQDRPQPSIQGGKTRVVLRKCPALPAAPSQTTPRRGGRPQHLEDGKNLPGDRNLYPLPAGRHIERAPGLLLVEIVGDGATFERWCPLGEFLLALSSVCFPSSRSSRLSWVSLGEQWRGERFRRLRTSLLAEASGPGAPCLALTGPWC